MGHRAFSPARLATICFSPIIPFLISGCSQQQATHPMPVASTTQGSVHGGRQPVIGATIQLYAVGGAGDGSPSTPLLTRVVTSDSNGGFTITNDYTCPTPGSLVYLVATGGNPGLPGNQTNPALALMTVLGQCGQLGPSTRIAVNELTTVAGVWSLAPFMTSYSAVGSGSGDASDLADAFALAMELVDPTTGSIPGQNVPAGVSVPVEQVNMLADALAACVNSTGGVAGDGSTCGNLFDSTRAVDGTAATNTIEAGLNLAHGFGGVWGLISPTAPYQPVPSYAPRDYQIHWQFTSPTPALELGAGEVSLLFPRTAISTSAAMQGFNVLNLGTSAIALNGITILGPAAADYSLTTTCQATLPILSILPGGCAVQVTFTPTATGARSAFVVVKGDAPNSPLFIPLMGTGITPPTQPGSGDDPSNLRFFEQGEAQAFTVTNTYSTPMNISSIDVSSSNWTQMNNCGSVLDPQSTCTVAVIAGSANGQFTGTLTVTSDNPGGPQTAHLISDIRAQSGPPIRFGIPGATHVPSVTGGVFDHTANGQDYYLYTATLSGEEAGDFSLSASTCTAQTAQGNPPVTCEIDISSHPTLTGMRSAYVTTNAGEIYLVRDIGVSNNPGFIFYPTALAFGSQPIGSTTARNFEMDSISTNGSVLPPWNFTITQGAGNAGDFTLLQGCGTALKSPCTGTIQFTPTTPGTRYALASYTDTTGIRRSLFLIGQASGTLPTITPSSIDFGSAALNTTSSPQTVTVTLPSNDAATATIVESNSPFHLSQSTSCAQGTSPCQFQIVWSPTVSGPSTGTLKVTDSVTGLSTTAALSGRAGGPFLTLSTTSLTFGTRNVGMTSTPQNITLTNTGSLPLTISNFYFAWQDPNGPGIPPIDFFQTNNCGTLSSGTSCVVSVSFSPSKSGSQAVLMEINSNATTSPDKVTLSGTGN